MVSTVSRYGKQLRHATTMPLQLVRNTWPTRKYDTNPHSEEPGTSERSHNSHRTENSSSKTSFPPGKVSQRREIICMSTCGSSSTWKTPVCMSVCMKFCTHVRVYIYIYHINLSAAWWRSGTSCSKSLFETHKQSAPRAFPSVCELLGPIPRAMSCNTNPRLPLAACASAWLVTA